MSDPFHAYDIRGVYPATINDEIAYKIGKAIVEKFKIKKIIIGRDHRISSPSLFKNLAKGLTEMGCDVTDIGSTATPILYHYTVTEEFPLGIMITASHNPKEYNGFKICTKEGQLITYENGGSEIEEIVRKDIFSISEKKGNVASRDVLQDYVRYVNSRFARLSKKYKIVVDTGNGVGGPIVREIISEHDRKQEDVELTEMFFELDGDYPNHEANPLLSKNTKDISEKIRSEKADFGFAFDGDCDRCILFDENGDAVNSDFALCLIAEEELKKHKGATFYYDLRFSKITKEHIEELGGKAVMLKVGNPVYKEKMYFEEGGIAAAELSGHVFYKENYSLDDGFYHMIKMIGFIDDILSDKDDGTKEMRKVSQIFEKFHKYYQSEEINNKVRNADDVISEVKKRYHDAKQLELDGVTVEYDSFWFNLRKSNTEPLVRLRLEADTKELLDEKTEEVVSFIKRF